MDANEAAYFRMIESIGDFNVGVVGSGSMGCGIAQVAAQAGHSVWINDSNPAALERAARSHQKLFVKLVEKGKMTLGEANAVQKRITYTRKLQDLAQCKLVIEAVIEDLAVKRSIFQELEIDIALDAVLATNTSSLSVMALGGMLNHPERVVGLHFFNPAPLMPLVEVVPSLLTLAGLADDMLRLMRVWGKVPVLAKDTPGFIVNRVARPFYGESLRICEEGMANPATIDHALRTVGGFRMGPFELMDLIGNDINFAVTSSVFRSSFYDPRYRPSITQQRMVEAHLLGQKTGRGYFDHSDLAVRPTPIDDPVLHRVIFDRVIAMLVNEATDALFLGIATREDLDIAMTQGVNYPKGLLRWADELGPGHILDTLDTLSADYREDRYRASVLLRRMVRQGETFY